MLSVRTTAGTKPVATIKVRTAVGLQTIQRLYVRTAAGLKLVYSALSASADQASATASLYTRTSPTIITPGVTVTASGGLAPYSYAWTTPDAGWGTQSPADPLTSFFYPNVGPGQSYSATWTCTVTDSVGSTATAQVAASVSNTY